MQWFHQIKETFFQYMKSSVPNDLINSF